VERCVSIAACGFLASRTKARVLACKLSFVVLVPFRSMASSFGCSGTRQTGTRCGSLVRIARNCQRQLCARCCGEAGGCVAHAARAAEAVRTVHARAAAAQVHGCTHAIAGLNCGAPLHLGCSRQWCAACCRAAGGCRAPLQAPAHQQLEEQQAAVRASRRALQECDDRQQQRRQQSRVRAAYNDGPLDEAQLAATAVATRAVEAAAQADSGALPEAECVLQRCRTRAGRAFGTQAAALDAPFTKEPACDACVTYSVRRELWAAAPRFCCAVCDQLQPFGAVKRMPLASLPGLALLDAAQPATAQIPRSGHTVVQHDSRRYCLSPAGVHGEWSAWVWLGALCVCNPVMVLSRRLITP
jgi:hypothetical protein